MAGADYNKDARVNLGELKTYLSDEVRKATGDRQSSRVGGRFDPPLTIGR